MIGLAFAAIAPRRGGAAKATANEVDELAHVDRAAEHDLDDVDVERPRRFGPARQDQDDRAALPALGKGGDAGEDLFDAAVRQPDVGDDEVVGRLLEFRERVRGVAGAVGEDVEVEQTRVQLLSQRGVGIGDQNS